MSRGSIEAAEAAYWQAVGQAQAAFADAIRAEYRHGARARWHQAAESAADETVHAKYAAADGEVGENFRKAVILATDAYNRTRESFFILAAAAHDQRLQAADAEYMEAVLLAGEEAKASLMRAALEAAKGGR